MWQRGKRGIKNSLNMCDVINGWPLTFLSTKQPWIGFQFCKRSSRELVFYIVKFNNFINRQIKPEKKICFKYINCVRLPSTTNSKHLKIQALKQKQVSLQCSLICHFLLWLTKKIKISNISNVCLFATCGTGPS